VSRPIVLAVGFGFVVLAAGRLLTPLGISKIRATPTWSLYSIGAAVFDVFAPLLDMRREAQTGWAFFVRAAGSNTLLTYLLPDVWYFASACVGFTLMDAVFQNRVACSRKDLCFHVRDPCNCYSPHQVEGAPSIVRKIKPLGVIAPVRAIIATAGAFSVTGVPFFNRKSPFSGSVATESPTEIVKSSLPMAHAFA